MHLHANFVHDVSQFENIDECWAPCCSEVPDKTETDNPFIRKYIRNVLIPNLLVYGCLAIPNHAKLPPERDCFGGFCLLSPPLFLIIIFVLKIFIFFLYKI